MKLASVEIQQPKPETYLSFDDIMRVEGIYTDKRTSSNRIVVLRHHNSKTEHIALFVDTISGEIEPLYHAAWEKREFIRLNEAMAIKFTII